MEQNLAYFHMPWDLDKNSLQSSWNMSEYFQISVNSPGGELEVSILQSQYSKSGLSCGSGIHIESSIMWQNLEFFSSSILSRTVAGREKGARKMGAFIGRRLMIIWCRGCSMRQGLGRRIKSVRQANPITPPEITCPFSTKSATVWQCDWANSMARCFKAFAPNTAFLGPVHCWEHVKKYTSYSSSQVQMLWKWKVISLFSSKRQQAKILLNR